MKKLYKIMVESWGGTRQLYMECLSYEEALEICESYNWEICLDGGYIWDMVIDEQ